MSSKQLQKVSKTLGVEFIAELVNIGNWVLQDEKCQTVAVGVAGLLGYFIGGRNGAIAAAGLATTYVNLHVNIMELINKLTPAQKRALCAAITLILKQCNLPPVVEVVVHHVEAVILIIDAINFALSQFNYKISKP